MACGMCIAAMLATVLVCVSAAPQGIDATRIYFQDETVEVRSIAILEHCRKDPTCDESSLRQIKCKDRTSEDTIAALNNRMKELVDQTAGGCNPLMGEVVWPSTGQCVKLLTQGPCSPSQWVKLSTNNLEPVCAPLPCTTGTDVIINGVCLPLKEVPACPPSQILFTNEFGVGECDCTPGTVYYEPTKLCYTPYSTGPCERGSIIKVMDAGMSGHAQCVPNPCPGPNMVQMDQNCLVQEGGDKTTTCHSLNTQGPCDTGRSLIIDNTLAEPICTTTQSIFFGILSTSCSRGSTRDSQGRCRVDFAHYLRELSLVVTSRPRTNSNRTCPPGQTLVAGICLGIFGKRPKGTAASGVQPSLHQL